VKNNFTLPAFLLVLFGLAWVVICAISFNPGTSNSRGWTLVACLFLVIVEAWQYWFIKDRNTQRDASLLHILLLMLALASLFLRDGLLLWHAASRHHFHPLLGMRGIIRVQYTLFAGLLIVAHIFFIRVLRAAFSKQPQTTLPS